MNLLNKIILLPIILLVLTLNTNRSWAQELDSLNGSSKSWDRFSITAGAFVSGLNSDITFLNQQLGAGLVIDFEDALGLSANSFVFRSNANYVFGKKRKHTVSAGFFGVYRKAKKILENELVVGGIVYPVGAELNSKYDLSIIRGKYDYTFFQDNRVSIGASFGLFIMPVNFSVKANLIGESTSKFVAPLPLLGLRTDFKITNKIYLRQSVELLYLSTSTFKGSILDLNVLLEYYAFKKIAFGMGVDSNRINISVLNQASSLGDFTGIIRTDYTGVILYGKFYL